jgi:AcrR family transcriptional regulator
MARASKGGGLEKALSSREQVLDAAARLFSTKGYDATSMREIGAAVGISAAALYHHFPSKEEIFCATHNKGMAMIFDDVERACAARSDPWERLEAAAVAHCEALLGAEGYRTIITPHFPDVSDEIRIRLIQQRDAYERFMKDLVAALNLPAHIDPFIFRMQFLGSINWTTSWYRPGGRLTPSTIARQVVRQMRDGNGRSGAARPGTKKGAA